MALNLESILRAVSVAHDGYLAALDVADGVAAVLLPADQQALQAKLAELRAQNDAARARRHAKLQAAGTRGQ